MLTGIFSLFASYNISKVLRVSDNSDERHKTVNQKRQRLLRIAVSCGFCCLSNMASILSISSNLGEWNRTSELSLQCGLRETWNTREWGVYGLNENAAASVICSQELSLTISEDCIGDCAWIPEVSSAFLNCPSLKLRELKKIL